MSLALIALFAGAGLAAQPSGSFTGLIVGEVIDASRGRPIAGAVVSLSGPPSREGVPHQRVLTGPDGRFFFYGLRRGRYGVSATKGGYTDGAYGRLRPLGPAQQIDMPDSGRIGDVTVRLWKQAAISGTVIDEAGEPQVNVPVRAYRRGVLGGRPRYMPSVVANTDDRGVFRIAGLVPGQYIVGTSMTYRGVMASEVRETFAQARGSENASAVAAAAEIISRSGIFMSGEAGFALASGTLLPPPGKSGQMIYLPTYHPAAVAGEAAAVIELTAGQQYEAADLRLTPVGAVPVGGWLAGPNGPIAGAQLRLTAGAEAESLLTTSWLTATTDRAGRFVFPAVPAGHYVLRTAQSGAARSMGETLGVSTHLWAELPLSVGLEPVDGLMVSLRDGLRISGRLEFDGAPLRPRGFGGRVQISFERADPEPDMERWIHATRSTPDGAFISPGLGAGRYYVRVADSPEGWMFLGATVDGRDITDRPLHVSSDIDNVVVAFTERWSGIQGSVQTSAGRNDAALVIAFPTDRAMWSSGGANPRRNRSTRPTATGQYTFNLPPGEYYVLAIPDESATDWQDPDFLQAARDAAVLVRVDLGERKTQDLRPMVIR